MIHKTDRFDHDEYVGVSDGGQLDGGFEQNSDEERLHLLPLLDDAEQTRRVKGRRHLRFSYRRMTGSRCTQIALRSREG